MIRIDALWACTAPVDMRAGADRLLACVVQTLGAAQAHHGYLFANARATRVKLIVHDGWGVWCAARRLNAGHFVWPRGLESSTPLALERVHVMHAPMLPARGQPRHRQLQQLRLRHPLTPG